MKSNQTTTDKMCVQNINTQEVNASINMDTPSLFYIWVPQMSNSTSKKQNEKSKPK